MKPATKQDIIRNQDAKINAISRLVDSLIIILTFWALLEWFQETWISLHFWILFVGVCGFAFFSDTNYSYNAWRGNNLSSEISALFSSWIATCALLIVIGLFYRGGVEYNRWTVYSWFLLTPIELLSWHAIVRYFLYVLGRSGATTRSVAIAGATQLGLQLKEKLEQMPWAGYKFVGFYDDRDFEKGRRLRDEEARPDGNFDDLNKAAKAGKVDIVFMVLPLKAEERIRMIVDRLADSTASVYMMLDLFSFDLLNAKSLDIQGMPAVSICETPHTGVDNLVKRIFDIVVGSSILALIAIPMILIAIGVKLSSPGPVFFRQNRYGMNGEKIKVWKFRSMTVADDGEGKVVQATKEDARITKFGKILRRTSLDELPQFFNVLSGTMSIVGPRPHAVSHNEEYRSQIKRYMLRHKVKPGITGLAQVNGFRGETDTIDKMEGRIRYDLEYIQNWSVLLDLKIIIETVFKGFYNPNAY